MSHFIKYYKVLQEELAKMEMGVSLHKLPWDSINVRLVRFSQVYCTRFKLALPNRDDI